jgi:hypothetical protein
MSPPLIPTSYEQWKHCITVLCRIPLSAGFIENRLASLRNPAEFETRKFVATWGEEHRLQVVSWFESARRKFGVTPDATRHST